MLIINDDLYIRSKEDIVAVRAGSREITLHLASGYFCDFFSSAPDEDAMRLSKGAFSRYPGDDDNEILTFHTTRG